MYKDLIWLKRSEGEVDWTGNKAQEWGNPSQIRGMVDFLSSSNDFDRDALPDSTHIIITDGIHEIESLDLIVDRHDNEYAVDYVDNVGDMDHHLELYVHKL